MMNSKEMTARLILVLLLCSAPAVHAQAVPANAPSSSHPNTTLTGPVTFGSPDQPFGVRRAVTDADRAAIQLYRSKTPTFTTTFSQPSDLSDNWTFIHDDDPGNKSCRRSGNAETSSAGLRFKTVIATDCNNRWSTGSIVSKATYSYGFFEATLKIADIHGMNNAFWITSLDHYEIDIGEVRYPNYSHLGLQYWPVPKPPVHAGVGFGAHFTDNLSYNFHDYGVLWSPTGLIYEVDGEPIAALVTNNAIKGPITLLLSNALGDWANGPVPDHPEGHAMVVRSVRVVPLDADTP